MKKIFLLLSICAFALCFSSFHTSTNNSLEKNEKVSDLVPPSFLIKCLITSNVWQQTVKDLTTQHAQAVYNDFYGSIESSETAAKRVALAQKMLNSKVGDSFNLYLVSYFTTDNYLQNISDLQAELESAIDNQFDPIAGVVP